MHTAVIPTAPASRLRLLRRRLATALTLVLAGVSTAAFPAAGDLDLTFGADGVVFVDGLVGNDRVRALLPLPDGSVLAAGYMDNGQPTTDDLAVLKLDPAGNPDLGFGTGGVAFANGGGDGDEAYALLRQPDGRIVAAGSLEPSAHPDFAIVRFNADGTLDTSFGESDGLGARRGFARANMGPDENVNDHATALARQSDGKFVLAGQGYADADGFRYARFSLVRFDANGDIDTSFGTDGNGKVFSPGTVFQAGEFATGIALRRNGALPASNKVTVVGYVFAKSKALVRRYDANGTLDTTFDSDGVLTIDDALVNSVATGMYRINAAVLQEDGKLVVVGEARDRGFTFMRFNPNGSRDAGFGNNGRVSVKFSDTTREDLPYALALQADGKIVAAGHFTATYNGDTSADFGVVRLLPDGTPDPSFGDGQGRSTYPLTTDTDVAAAVAIMARGEVLAAGHAQRIRAGAGSLNDDMAFLRLQGDPGIFSDGFE